MRSPLSPSLSPNAHGAHHEAGPRDLGVEGRWVAGHAGGACGVRHARANEMRVWNLRVALSPNLAKTLSVSHPSLTRRTAAHTHSARKEGDSLGSGSEKHTLCQPPAPPPREHALSPLSHPTTTRKDEQTQGRRDSPNPTPHHSKKENRRQAAHAHRGRGGGTPCLLLHPIAYLRVHSRAVSSYRARSVL
jgi:hypothetical protein